ncbi:MAG: HEPN domain-containing protein [Patescibacteria group bacterium]
MSQDEATRYWLISSQEDLEVAQNLFESKRFNHALFFLQLSLEKLIKAIHVIQKDEPPLYVHNLVLLAQKAGLEMSESELADLKEISSFNISARYDSYKRDFYKKATREFAEAWMTKGKAIYLKLKVISKKNED